MVFVQSGKMRKPCDEQGFFMVKNVYNYGDRAEKKSKKQII